MKKLECTCEVHCSRLGTLRKVYEESSSIVQCPMCAAAPDMAEMLRGLLSEDLIPYLDIRALLKKAGVL